MAIEKFTFLDELGIQKLSEVLLTKVNSRIVERIVQDISDASDANHIASAALLNSLIKTRDELIAANTTAAGTNKTEIEAVVSSIDALTDDVTTNKTAIDGVVSDITSLDEKVDGLTHLTIDTVTGVIDDVADPQTDILYLQRDDESDTTWMLYIYREDGTWVQIGDTGVDLSGYWSKDDNESIKETIGVPEMVPLKNEKILAAIDAAFENTDVITPKDPNLQYLTINDSGELSASDNLKSLTVDTPVDLVIPSTIDGIVVKSIAERGFSNCTSLTSITIPEGVTKIGAAAFFECVSLVSITIPSSVISIDINVFPKCTSLTSINVDPNNTAYTSENGVLFNKNKTTIIRYPIGKTGTTYTIPNGVTTIDKNAFHDCDRLTSIIIPESVTEISNNAIYNCTSLTSINIPEGVISIGDGVFCSCTALTSITIPNSVTRIGANVFHTCSKLTSITIPESVTSIGTGTFYNCRSLTTININKPKDSITGAPWSALSTVAIRWKELRNVNVTFDSTQGSVSGAGSYLPGDKVELTASPVGENIVCRWSYTIDNTPHVSESRTLTFTMPFEDVELALTFTKVNI